MKSLIISILLLIMIITAPLSSQNTTKRVHVPRDPSIRAEAVFSIRSMPEDVVWYRTVYRLVYLTDEENAALYYPTEPIGAQANLYTTIFKLLVEKKINAYEYLDGREVFDDKTAINVRDYLDSKSILYEESYDRRSKDTLFRVEDADINSALVKSVYIKEDWFFDSRNSSYKCKINAMCPLRHLSNDYDYTEESDTQEEPVARRERTEPLFWVAYEDLAPYLMKTQIMTSNTNNNTLFNFDDFFTTRRYKGEIFKATNLMNVALINEKDETKRKAEQQQIEKELLEFETNLWKHTLEEDNTLNKAQRKAEKKAAEKAIKNQKSAPNAPENKPTTTPLTPSSKRTVN